MSLIAKAEVLQHKRMDALRRYAEDLADIERRRHELDLASARAWGMVIHAGWATADLTGLGLKAPKQPRARRRVASGGDPVEPTRVPADPDGGDDSDG